MYKISSKKSIYNIIKEGTIYDEVDNMWSYFENTLGAEKKCLMNFIIILIPILLMISSTTSKKYYEIDEI